MREWGVVLRVRIPRGFVRGYTLILVHNAHIRVKLLGHNAVLAKVKRGKKERRTDTWDQEQRFSMPSLLYRQLPDYNFGKYFKNWQVKLNMTKENTLLKFRNFRKRVFFLSLYVSVCTFCYREGWGLGILVVFGNGWWVRLPSSNTYEDKIQL